METIAERIGICKHCLTDETRFCHTDCDQYTMYKAAVRQKEIDDIDLKETQRQRDEYYDELVKLRIERAEWMEKACENFCKTICKGYQDTNGLCLVDGKCETHNIFRKAMEK